MLEMKRYSKYNPQNYAFMTKLAPDISLSMNTNGLNSLIKRKSLSMQLAGQGTLAVPNRITCELTFQPRNAPTRNPL